ncbi:MAG: polysaccharide deacetylase family protein [Bacteroidota bacterium]
MKLIPAHTYLLCALILGCKNPSSQKIESSNIDLNEESIPTVSFTFDDGITSDLVGFPFEEWNQMILSHLEREDLTAAFFVTGSNKLDIKGQQLLKSWDDKGHLIANHTFTHPNFNTENHTARVFESELLRTDSIISKFDNSVKLFRFPYLKEGQNSSKVDSIRAILSRHNYSNGYVTIDASDWYVNHRLIQKIKKVGISNTQIDAFRDFYLQHILERAEYYEKLSWELNGRHINHTLLLHHNLVSALFLGDLISEFKAKGWKLVDAGTAFKDSTFQQIPNPDFAGESLIWSMAKQSGKFEKRLRYPAEDSRYEKKKMDELGL